MVSNAISGTGLALALFSLSCAPSVVQQTEMPGPEPVYVQEITPEQFNTVVLESNLPVAVDFYFEGCVSCPRLKPVFEEACRDFYGRVKCVSFDSFQDDYAIAESYAVDDYPTMLPFCHGQAGEEIKVWVNFEFSEDKMHEKLEELIQSCP